MPDPPDDENMRRLREACRPFVEFAPIEALGIEVSVLPLTFGRAQICTNKLGDRSGYLETWSYPDPVSAIVALMRWRLEGFAGEPTLWHRHTPSNRRRPFGVAGGEYVEP